MSKLSFDSAASSQDDDFFFGTLERRPTNLEELFGVEATRPEPNASLKYHPKKQQVPSKLAPTTATNPANQAWSTQVAKIASAYKDGELLAGKVGVALLQNADGVGKIIVYKTKTNVLATLTLDVDIGEGQLHVQGAYLQFFDDQQRYWSLHFDKSEDELSFVASLEKMGNTVRKETSLKPKEEIAKQSGPSLSPRSEAMDSLRDDNSLAYDPKADMKKTASKTALISRMAKMGQQLPKLTNVHNVTTTDYSDSSDAEVLATPMLSVHKPTVISRGAAKMHQQTQLVATNSGGGVNSMYLGPAQAMETQFMQMIVTENRTQNSEMRMNINKLETKIEKVLNKIDNFHPQGQQSNKEDEIIGLEEKLLELKKENRKLRLQMENGECRRPRDAIETVITAHYNELKTLGVSVTADMDVSKLLSHLLRAAAALKEESDEHILRLVESVENLQESLSKMSSENVSMTKALTSASNLEQSNKTLQAALDASRQECTALQQKCIDVTSPVALEHTADSEKKIQTEATIKAIMNSLYGNLARKVEELHDLRKEKVLAIVGKTIREETLRAIHQLAEERQQLQQH